jgi:hypothetical protein
MEEKTKKKRVQKRAVRKKAVVAEPVPVAASPAVTKGSKKSRKSAKPAPSSSKARSTIPIPTFEQVQLRAYFISERRRKLGLPGSEHHDWLAAERELRAELTV